MQPIIRLTNYIEEYKKLVYESYAGMHNIIHTTYYQLDYDNTVYDPNFMETYHTTGDLSGRKYHKVHLFPVIFSQQVLPTGNSSEKGFGFFENISYVTIDPICGLTPHVGDIFSFNISDHYSDWIISNVEPSGTLNKPYWKCKIDQHRVRENSFNVNTVTSENIFIENWKKIFSLSNGSYFLKSIARLDKLINKINEIYFRNSIQCHSTEEKIVFPELELIMFSIDTSRFSKNILYGDPVETKVNINSLFSLFCLPNMHDFNLPLVLTTESKLINKRISLYNDYKEYVISEEGTENILDIIYKTEDEKLNAKECIEKILNKESNLILNDDFGLSILTNELSELIKGNFITPNIVDVVSTNFFESVIEHSILNTKILKLANDSVVLK